MPDPTDETSGLVDDLATVLEDTGVHVEELIEELLEAVDLAETIAAALQDGERDQMGDEVDGYAAARAQAARATSAGLAAASAALRGAWDAVPGLSPATSGAGER